MVEAVRAEGAIHRVGGRPLERPGLWLMLDGRREGGGGALMVVGYGAGNIFGLYIGCLSVRAMLLIDTMRGVVWMP